ncbi:hypothetical protein [Streptomyces sp. NPDC020917]|uniref:hypothetical protein n=1 Tax=Streptomyces sp. NPDC020917 TaxID=3365102 RepID=UPI0037A3172B
MREALETLGRIGRTTPSARAALLRLHDSDRRLSSEADCRAVLDDEEVRAAVARLLALPVLAGDDADGG